MFIEAGPRNEIPKNKMNFDEICKISGVGAVQKSAKLVDPQQVCEVSVSLQKLVSFEPRTRLPKVLNILKTMGGS